MNHGTRYYYDPETCSFREVRTSPFARLKKAATTLALAALLAAGAMWGLDAQWVSSPQEVALRAENRALQHQLERVASNLTTLSTRLDDLAETDRELYRTLLQAEPISDDVRRVGVGGTDAYERFDRFSDPTANLLRETASALDRLERQMALQSTSYRDLKRFAQARADELAQLPAIRPANGLLVSGYGMRMHPILKVRKMHSGIDLLLEMGTPVVATGDGVIKRTGRSYTYGRYVDIEHPAAGYMTRYAHLSKIGDGMRRGVRVKRGDVVAYSGNSGRSTGPHLHYEVRDLDGRPLNPVQFLVPDMTPDAYQTLVRRTHQFATTTGSGDGTG
jgi:murein DD-endopeptidase MepM/ murein hydrolase activator NlpD